MKIHTRGIRLNPRTSCWQVSAALGRHEHSTVSHLTIPQLLHSIFNTCNGHWELFNLGLDPVSGSEIQHSPHACSGRNTTSDKAEVPADQVQWRDAIQGLGADGQGENLCPRGQDWVIPANCG
jgi:hypothetical protein